jgi:starch phosphorylase
MVVARTDSVPSATALREAVQRHARYSLAQAWETLTTRQIFACVGLAVRDIMVDRLLESEQGYRQADARQLYYLSIEYLPGRYLVSNLINLGLYEVCREALGQLNIDLDTVAASEPDAALGNGGLGRLAACFLDSLATLGMPGHGYGINYEYGLFRQGIDRGDQRKSRTIGSPFVRPGRSSGRMRPVA